MYWKDAFIPISLLLSFYGQFTSILGKKIIDLYLGPWIHWLEHSKKFTLCPKWNSDLPIDLKRSITGNFEYFTVIIDENWTFHHFLSFVFSSKIFWYQNRQKSPILKGLTLNVLVFHWFYLKVVWLAVSPYRNLVCEIWTLHLHSGTFGPSQTAQVHSIWCLHSTVGKSCPIN